LISRFEINQAKGNPLVAKWLEKEISQWPGVASARCRASTGRLRIQWTSKWEKQTSSPESLEKLLGQFSLQQAWDLPSNKPRTKNFAFKDNTPSSTPWHNKALKDLINNLKADAQNGLNSNEAQLRAKTMGLNAIPKIEPRTGWEILAAQFWNPSTALLVSSAAASVLTGGLLEAAVILGVIGLNGGIGYATESQAERCLEKLSGLGPSDAVVVREGQVSRVKIEAVVPGDILVLRPGVSIAADARVISCDELSVDESILTGESYPVVKKTTPSLEEMAPLSSRENMVFKGSAVVSGTGRALVVETGVATQAGRIQNLLQDNFHQKTLLQQKLDELNKELVYTSIAASGLLFLSGVLRGQPKLQLAKTAISMAVAAVPEGLPTVSTWTLSRAVSQLMKHQVLVRDLQAIETLSGIQTLCLDKTGTITLNQMKVRAVGLPDFDQILYNGECLQQSEWTKSLAACAALCNDADLQTQNAEMGSPTELSLLHWASDCGHSIPRLRQVYRRTGTIRRSAERRYMITRHVGQSTGKAYHLMKGDPRQVLQHCHLIKTTEGFQALNSSLRKKILGQNQEVSGRGLRTLGFAYRDFEIQQWVWLGLIGMQDPPRPHMKEVLSQFHRAGVKTVMITGDQKATAEAIAQELNISNGQELVCVDLPQLQQEGHSQKDLNKVIAQAHVFARVSPEDKKMLVEAIRHEGQIVGMVGDGINDAPALKAAHVGIAIGKGGAEVAREVAGVVLLDDTLDRLLEALALGRAASESLRKSIHYLVSSNLSEMSVVLTESLLGLPETMDSLQLMWVNLITDTFPALSLAMGKPRADILDSRPKDPREKLINKNEAQRMLKESGLFSGLVLSSLLWGHSRGLSKEQNQSLAMNTLTVSQILHSFSCVSDQPVKIKNLLKTKKSLVTSAIGSLTAHYGMQALPGVRTLFHVAPLKPLDFALSTALSALGFTLIESGKSKTKKEEEETHV
jgi:Ca2+-transporting ATPase